MIVVADSGPLHYLVLLEHIDLLRRFYGQVLVPDLVAGELTTAGAPDIVRKWMANPPTWVDVRPVAADAISRVTDDLDLGERAAIALAEAVAADLLLIDGNPFEDISAVRRAVLVMKGDTLYRPEDLYNAIGIKPFLPSVEL